MNSVYKITYPKRSHNKKSICAWLLYRCARQGKTAWLLVVVVVVVEAARPSFFSRGPVAAAAAMRGEAPLVVGRGGTRGEAGR